MTELQFTKRLVKRLKPHFGKLEVSAHKAVLYSIHFDDNGKLKLHVDKHGAPKRGMGMGFEQDIVVYSTPKDKGSDTSVVPWVITEVKFEKMGSHAAIVYSEKARRIRTVYPYVRYGLILGAMETVPPRILRLGTEFDFIYTLPQRISKVRLASLVRLLKSEIRIARQLGSVFTGKKPVREFHRSIGMAR